MNQDESQKRVEELLGHSIMFERIDITVNDLCNEIEKLRKVLGALERYPDPYVQEIAFEALKK